MKTNILSIFALLFTLLSITARAQTGTPCPAGCDTIPLCIQENEGFRFEYFGALDEGNGRTQLKFKVINSTPDPFASVMFDLPGSDLAAISPQASYIGSYHYIVENNFNQEAIKFTGLNTLTYRHGQSDIFRYVVDSATFHNGLNTIIDVQAKAGAIISNVTFNLENCNDKTITPLPVELVSFEGAAVAEGVALTWTTASEKNNSYFSVQYSNDGSNFESVGRVEGKGTTAMASNYSFTHKVITGDKMYYRLKQVNLDLTYNYSKVIIVSTKEKATLPLTVYPNPVIDQEINLHMENPDVENVNLSLLDLNGRLVLKQTETAARDMKISLKNASLKPGIYILNAQAGSQTAHQKIVIQ